MIGDQFFSNIYFTFVQCTYERVAVFSGIVVRFIPYQYPYMHTTVVPRFVRRLTKIVSLWLIGILFLGTLPESASAVSSWNPTLLVNTESFQQIDSGDGTTDIELRFGSTANTLKYLNTAQKFQFSKGISVIGAISGSSLTIDGVAGFSGAVTVRGATQLYSTLNVTNTIIGNSSITAKGALSGASLRVSGSADVHGALTASGAFRTDSNITINDDADSNDAVLTFGNTSGNQTLKFLNGTQRFQFTRGLSIVGHLSGSSLNVDRSATIGGTLTATGAIRTKGNLSGSTLTVDGNVTLRGVTYSGPTAQGASNTFLRNDGAGNLTWQSTSVGNGSGGIMSMHPDYPGAIYFASGSSMVGQLTMSGGTSGLENSYAWTTSRGTLQDYWISVRGRVPDNFSSWDPSKAVEFRFKTGVIGTANNHLALKIRDTAGSLQTLSGSMVSTNFYTGRFPALSGTWTPQGYFTVYVKVAATSAANAAAYASYLNMNFETNTP